MTDERFAENDERLALRDAFYGLKPQARVHPPQPPAWTRDEMVQAMVQWPAEHKPEAQKMLDEHDLIAVSDDCTSCARAAALRQLRARVRGYLAQYPNLPSPAAGGV